MGVQPNTATNLALDRVLNSFYLTLEELDREELDRVLNSFYLNLEVFENPFLEISTNFLHRSQSCASRSLMVIAGATGQRHIEVFNI